MTCNTLQKQNISRDKSNSACHRKSQLAFALFLGGIRGKPHDFFPRDSLKRMLMIRKPVPNSSPVNFSPSDQNWKSLTLSKPGWSRSRYDLYFIVSVINHSSRNERSLSALLFFYLMGSARSFQPRKMEENEKIQCLSTYTVCFRRKRNGRRTFSWISFLSYACR